MSQHVLYLPGVLEKPFLHVTTPSLVVLSQLWKRLDGSELDGLEHFETNCQNVPGAAGAAVGAAAASAVCILSGTYTGA